MMGTTKAQASGYGTAAGTAIGSIWGPAGAAVGGALGGAVGGMLGQDPKAPMPVALPPPAMPGGASGLYQGWTIDPVTGRVVYYDKSLEGQYNPEEYRNQQLRDQLLGGNTAQSSLQAQIAAAQQLVERLSKSSDPAVSGPKATDFVGKEWVNEDGSFKKPGSVNISKEMGSNSDLYKRFLGDTKGGDYGSGSLQEKFSRWVSDAYKNNIEALDKQYENALKTAKGNTQTTGEGLDAAKLRLQQLMDIQKSGGGNLDNPLMNYLNRRNTGPAPDYNAQFADKYKDPWTGKMSDEADYQLGKSKQNINFDDLARQLGMGSSDPGIPDAKKFTADMLAKYGGAMGGERMDPLGAYDSSKLAQWRAAQDRVAQNQGASNLRSAEAMAAKRGLLGSSINDSSRLDAEMALQDALVGNAARTYSMDAQDQANWFNRKFQIDQHNSDVARQGAQGQASLAASGFGNEMAAKQLYESILGNRFGMNNSEQQRAFANMMAALGQRTALDQRSIDNTRYDIGHEEALDQQNFANRMGLLQYLSGDQAQSFNQEMGRNTAGMGQNQMGATVGLTTTGWQNDYNIANAAQQNAYNMGQFNQGQASSAADANRWNTLASALGQYGGSFGSQPTANDTAAVNRIQNTYENSQVPAANNPTYNPSTMYTPAPMPPQYQLAKPPAQSSYMPNTSGMFVGKTP